MAIDWGAFEYSGGNGIRVGVDVSIESISHADAACTFTVDYWTENQFSMSDTQTLNLGGSIGGSITFSNNAGGTAVNRGTRTYTYTYPDSSYGSSPGTKTFSATLSGAYNGVTPSSSHTSTIPARPVAAPDPVTGTTANRISDDSAKLTWNNHKSDGRPYDNVLVDRQIYGYGPSGYSSTDWTQIGNLGPNAEIFTDTTTNQNRKYQYRVRAKNSEGSSANDQTGVLLTSPGTPTGCTRTLSGANQVITWTNHVNYAEHETQVWRAANGVYSLLTTVAADVQTYTDTAPVTTTRWKYKVRHASTIQGAMTGDYSGETTETALVGGGGTAPAAPTGLAPANGLAIDPKLNQTMTWKHNPTDGSAQTRFLLRHRLVGGSFTIVDIAFSSSSYILPANAYGAGQSVEWQVATYGLLTTTASPYSALANFATKALVIPKYPLYLDADTGRVEARTSERGVIGQVTMYAGTAAPGGWLLCQGQSLLRTDYLDLFTVIGTTYGFVDATHFTLPDLRGRFALGAGGTGKAAAGDNEAGSAGSAPGQGAVSLLSHQHVHGIPSPGLDPSPLQPGTAAGAVPRNSNFGGHDHGGTGTRGLNNSLTSDYHPMLTLNFIIRAVYL